MSQRERTSDPTSYWGRDSQKLDEVLAFHAKQRSSNDLLKEFLVQQRANKPFKPATSKPSQQPSEGPVAKPTSLTAPKPSIQNRSSLPGHDGTSRWDRDQQKLEEVLGYQAKQRSSADLLAEFRAEQSLRRKAQRDSGATNKYDQAVANTTTLLAQPNANLTIEIEDGSAENVLQRSNLAHCGGEWGRDHERLDEVLAFHSKQRPSEELVSEFRSSRSSSAVSTPRLGYSATPVMSPVSIAGDGSDLCPSPMLTSTSPKSPKGPMGTLTVSFSNAGNEKSLARRDPIDPTSQWAGDSGKLDEVLAFHSKHRSSQDLLKEFQAQQRVKKERARRSASKLHLK